MLESRASAVFHRLRCGCMSILGRGPQSKAGRAEARPSGATRRGESGLGAATSDNEAGEVTKLLEQSGRPRSNEACRVTVAVVGL